MLDIAGLWRKLRTLNLTVHAETVSVHNYLLQSHATNVMRTCDNGRVDSHPCYYDAACVFAWSLQ